MEERYKSLVSVHLILTRTSGNVREILLQKRKNTGYMDGFYTLGASGHLEDNESVRDAVVRETMEELNVKVNPQDLELVTISHEKTEDHTYLRLFFHTEIYEGKVSIGEPDRCEEISWYDIDKLPENIVPHLKMEIDNFKNNKIYDEKGFKK